jgi:lysophospholipase L1-like esterase
MATPALSQEGFQTGDSVPLKALPQVSLPAPESLEETSTASVFVAPDTERHVLLTKPSLTILCVVLLALSPLVVPQLKQYREFWPNFRDYITFNGSAAGNLNDVPGGTVDANAAVVLPPAPEGSGEIEDPKASLIPFYKSLAATDAKQSGAITRIMHYGDSPLCADLITGTTRRKLQERFGDAGHGFILASRPWEWYVHDGIEFASTEWSHHPMLNGKLPDGMFGLGGVASRALGAGQISRYSPSVETGSNGKNNTRMEVYYLKQPNGGSFVMASGDGQQQTVNTSDPNTTSGFAEMKAAAPGQNTFEIKSAGGQVRLFGAALENDNPGVVYDSLGVTGAYAGLLAVQMNEQNWAEQLQHRKPNLIVINYGTNESQYDAPENFVTYENDLREVVRRIRAALPDAPVLIMSPMDRGRRNGGAVVTHPAIPKIVAMQRRVAQETGCAFFDTFTAMGGDGTMSRWYAGVNGQRLVGGDLMHPKPPGAEIVGALLSDAIKKGYERYQSAVSNAAQKK